MLDTHSDILRGVGGSRSWLVPATHKFVAHPDQLEPLTNEANQLMAIFVTIVRKTKAGMAKRKF